MSARLEFHRTIRGKILLLGIIPVLSISVILTLYHMSWQRKHLSNDLQRFGQSTAEYLAVAGKLAMFADDLESLQQIARGPARNIALHGVSFYKEDGTELLTLGELDRLDIPAMGQDHLWQDNQYRNQLIWYFRAAIELEAETMTDYGESTHDSDYLLGWAVVALSRQELHQRQQENLLIGSAISLIVTLLVAVVAWLLSHRIYRPITELTSIVETMEAGDLSVEAQVAGEREVQILARVINRLAASLNQTNIRLKEEVAEATGDLRRALQELEQALGAKDQFLARMSHELRTPLTTILGFTRRLEHTVLTEEQSEYRHAIQHSSFLLLSVINDILEFSRLQYGGSYLQETIFNLEDELEDIVLMHAYSAYEKSIELIMLIDSDVPQMFHGDAIRLKQILNNLLANSVKFTDVGEINVHVARYEPDESNRSVETDSGTDTVTLEISVSDTGIGILPEEKENLFQPFSQADTSISRRYGGSGLGLVICQQLIELMGGEIELDSEPGVGTTARFTLPLKCVSASQAELRLPHRSDVVAVLEPNPRSRRALRSQLTRWTRQVFMVADAAALIEIVAQRQGELAAVLISLGPEPVEEDRLQETLAGLRAHYRGPVLVLACMSSDSPPFPEHILRQYSPAEYLSKPVRRKKLLEKLNSLDSPGTSEPEFGSSQGPGDCPADGSLTGIEILVVEDNEFNQKLFAGLLQAEGATTVLADNGAEALERFQQSGCSLVLMDAHMPVIDGIEACRQIVQLARQKQRCVAVLGLTADTLDAERLRFLDAGAKEVLYKPVDEQALLEALCRYSGREYRPLESASILSGSSSVEALGHELSRLVARLRYALEEGRVGDSRDTIHQLLGLSGMYGIEEFRRMVEGLRESLDQQQGWETQRYLDALETLVHQIIGRDD